MNRASVTVSDATLAIRRMERRRFPRRLSGRWL